MNVAPPHGLEPSRWRPFLEKVAEERPYLWPNLQDAVAKRYLDPGISSVIAFPTGAGKSGVSHLKIGATLLATRRVIFLAPTHALVDQTLRDLKTAFPRRRVRSVREDEFSISADDTGPTDIRVMTPEACLLLGHLRPSTFERVGLLVFDECHLIHPRAEADQRSLDAMLCIIQFVRLAPEADLLLMSAMMNNADEIGAWIQELTSRKAMALSMAWKPTRQLRGCIVYRQQRVNELNVLLRTNRQQKRTGGVPVAVQRQLTAQPHGFFSIRQTWASQQRDDYAYLPFSSESPELRANPSWRLTANAGVLAAALAVPAARAGINTLVFSQSIPIAAKIAKRISDSLGPSKIELTQQEERWLSIAVDELGGTDYLYVDVCNDTITSRAATHHGLLLPEERRLVESLYARPDGLAVLSATGTLGQGMNLPSEFVIIAQDSRFDEKTGAMEMLEARELLNAAGRAGRAGKNATGIVIVIPTRGCGIRRRLNRRPRRPLMDAGCARSSVRLTSALPLTGPSDRCSRSDPRPSESSRGPRSLRSSPVSAVRPTMKSPGARLRQALPSDVRFAAFKKRRKHAGSLGRKPYRGRGLTPRTHRPRRRNRPSHSREGAETVAKPWLSSSLGLPEDVVSALSSDLA